MKSIHDMSAEELYEAGKYWADDEYISEIGQELVKTGDAEYLYLAGRYWSDKRYIAEIGQALVKTGNAEYLYCAGVNWNDKRYIPEIGRALAETGNAAYINLALGCWSDRKKEHLNMKNNKKEKGYQMEKTICNVELPQLVYIKWVNEYNNWEWFKLIAFNREWVLLQAHDNPHTGVKHSGDIIWVHKSDIKSIIVHNS